MNLFRRVKNNRRNPQRESFLSAALVQDIKEELRAQEYIKKDVLAELDNRKKSHKFFEQPAVLLLIGSLLTGGVGAGLSSWWQSIQKEREQALLLAQKAVDQKYHVLNETVTNLGEMHATTLSILSAMQLDSDAKRRDELKELIPGWKKSKREARIKSSLLLELLRINFGAKARQDFQNILGCYQNLNVGLSNMVEVVDDENGKRREGMEDTTLRMTESLNRHINGTLFEKLMSGLSEQLKSSEASSEASNESGSSASAEELIKPCRFDDVVYPPVKKKRKRAHTHHPPLSN